MQTNVDFFFYLHLVIIQKHYYEAKRVKPMLLQVAKPLNVNLLDLQMCIFKLTMKMQAPKDMDELFNTNIMTKLWVTISNNALLTQWLSEYLKLAKIAMVLVFRSKKDEQNFSMLAFMKDKLCNKLDPHLDTIIHMFALKITSLIKRLLQLRSIRMFGLVLPFSKFCSFHNTRFKCSFFHDLDKFGDCV